LDELIEPLAGVVYLNQAEDLTQVLRRYRHGAAAVLGTAWVVIAVLLIIRYRRACWRVALPPILAVTMTIGLLGAMGETLNLMHCLALLLVSGMGIDYAIFFAEANGAESTATGAAITLSAITTVLAFGLLSLSNQPVLHAIGLTILVGIALAWILAPLALKPS
jgi:predicted exporter